jgi:hypothetical protein
VVWFFDGLRGRSSKGFFDVEVWLRPPFGQEVVWFRPGLRGRSSEGFFDVEVWLRPSFDQEEVKFRPGLRCRSPEDFFDVGEVWLRSSSDQDDVSFRLCFCVWLDSPFFLSADASFDVHTLTKKEKMINESHQVCLMMMMPMVKTFSK